MPNKNYSRNAEEKLEVVKYAEKHGNAATTKHYDTDESNIRYGRKQKLVLAVMPAKKTKKQIKCSMISRDREQTLWIDIKGVDWD